jgi:protein-disulfide isomerase
MSKLSVSISSEDHRQGQEDAGYVLVEYGDYECPSCGEAYPIVKHLQEHFGKRLLFVFRNFPLSQMHPHAESAAETAEFAGSHGKFWEMHDLLFENQDRLKDSLLVELTAELQLAPARLQDALENRVFQPRVRADFAGGVRSGVNGTPTFFMNDQRHNGPFDFDSLVDAIERAAASR